MLNINFYFYNIRLVAKKSELKVHEKVWQTYPKHILEKINQISKNVSLRIFNFYQNYYNYIVVSSLNYLYTCWHTNIGPRMMFQFD